MLAEFKEYSDDEKIAVASMLDAARQLYEAYENGDPHFKEYLKYMVRASHEYQLATGYELIEDL